MSISEKDRQLFLSKLPEVLLNNENFMVFVQLAIEEFNIDITKIANFTDLIDPDKVPIDFIQELGSVVGFEKNYNAGEFNREILTRVQGIYSERGTMDSILMAANHGDDEGWVGGKLFIPGYKISLEESKVVLATDSLFRHSRTKHSGGGVFPDSDMYRPGVIVITVPYLDANIREAINKNTPAGIRCRYLTDGVFIPNDGESGSYNELTMFKNFKVYQLTTDEIDGKVQPPADYGLEMNLKVPLFSGDDTAVYSGKRGRKKHSGNLTIMSECDIELDMNVSMLSSSILNQGFGTEEATIVSGTGEVLDVVSMSGAISVTRDINKESFNLERETQSLIIPRRSTRTAVFSGINALSGPIKDDVECFAGTCGYTPDYFTGYIGAIADLRPCELPLSSVNTEYIWDCDIRENVDA